MTLTVGRLKVGLQPDQVIQLKGVKTLRFIRANDKNLEVVKQPLAALLNIHHANGGEKIAIQIATLADGVETMIGRVNADTPPRYEAIAHDLCASNFTSVPSSGRVCHSCPYLFPCSKRPAEDD